MYTYAGCYISTIIIIIIKITIVYFRNARRMPEDVMNALMEVIQLFGPMTLKSAEEYVSRMRKERRLHTETW
jgi:sulfite reductase alpha subunit-like flavoprotein